MPLIEPFQKHTFYSQVHIQTVLHFVVILYKLLSNKVENIRIKRAIGELDNIFKG